MRNDGEYWILRCWMQYQLENQSCSQPPGYFLEEKVLKKEANYQIYFHLWLSITYHRLWIDPVFWGPESMQSILYPWWVPLGIQAVKIVSKWIYNLMPSIPGGWNHQPSKLPSYPVSPNMSSWEITRHSMELVESSSHGADSSIIFRGCDIYLGKL